MLMTSTTTTWNAWMPRVLSILRIVAALLFMAHGLQKFFGFPAPFPVPLTPLLDIQGVIETAGGAMLLVGLFTRPVAFILSGNMAVAYFMSHAPRSFFPVANGGDAAILYCFIFFFLIFAGGGSWSIDAARAKTA
ncbi:MAG: DoxX family protein [Hyphomicrobiales bacterium]